MYKKNNEIAMNRRHYMPNTIRMDVKNEKNINRKTIIDIMIKDLRIESKFISYVSTPYSSKSWLVSFKEEYDIEKIVGVNVTINEEVVEIKDYNKPKKMLMYNTYKLLWLPHGSGLTIVQNYVIGLIGDVGEIRVPKIYEELYIDRDAPAKKKTEIKTGNVIMTISYLEDIHIKDIRGFHQYFGKTIRIVQFGDEMKCFGCNELGHIKTSCPYAEHTCKKCNKKGHRDCNFASRLNANEASTFPQNEEDHEFDTQHVSSSQINTIRDDVGTEEELITTSQINTINDIQTSIQKEGNLMNKKTALNLGNPNKIKKRGAEDLSLNSTTSSTEQENKKNRNDVSVNSSDSSLQSDNNESMNQTGEHDERVDEKDRNNDFNSENNGENENENGRVYENGDENGKNEREAKK